MHLRNLTILLFTFSTIFAIGQNQLVPQKIHIEGQIVGAENKNIVLANQSMGGVQSPLAKVMADDKGKFEIDTTIAFEDYYFIGVEAGQYVNLVLRGNDDIKVYGDAKDLSTLINIIGSEDSEILNTYVAQQKVFQQIEDSLRGVLQANPAKQDEINAYFKPLAENFYGYRNNFINSNQNSPALIATLNSINQEREWKMYKQVVELLANSFPLSPTVANVKKYVMQKDVQLQQEKASNSMFEPGTAALDIALPNLDGDTLRLSDLKGKVVLVDFWASWCGPCRRENPNVVKAYNKYSKDGFDVYSVSLDKPGAKERWKAAIAKDGLICANHVSDLKGWSSAAAQAYKVRSIPFTVLIDQEGNIIGTNIRGPRLEAELAKIFGY